MSKRVLSLVLALVMVLGAFSTVFAAETVNEKLEWLKEKGLVVGDAGTGDLRLADPIKRSEVAVMITKALDLEAVANASAAFPSVFKDMSPLHWANGFVNVAAGRGFISGYPDNSFLPENNVNYAEMASMLVRIVPGAMSAEEQAKAVWPTTWLAKAAELGLFDGVAVADYNAPATRENVFNMVYNAVMNHQAGNYTIVKAIVLENYRVEKLAKDEVVVEIIEEVQRAKFVEESRKDMRGEQISLTIPAKLDDVENLLGKVANFTLDKDGNVVAINIDPTYKVEVLTEEDTVTTRKFGSYSVEIGERFDKKDERIFRTYFNNEAYAYEDFIKELGKNAEVEYAKVTTKNGKVVFLDAFNFTDISPVKEVKNDGANVLVYNDAREGTTKNISLSATAKILFATEGNLSVGAREDIKAFDVIHEYKGGYIVRKDADVSGTYEKVTSNRDNEYFVNVEGEKYLIPDDEAIGKQAVYAYDEDEFYTLDENRTAGAALREFEDEEVTILLDLTDKLQYIGAEVEMAEFAGIITRVMGSSVRVLKSDGKTYDYTGDLDTKVDGSKTGHRGLNSIIAGDLVYMAVDGDKIDEIKVLTKYNTKGDVIDYLVNDLDTREIDIADGEKPYRILSNTLFFRSDGKNIDALTAKQVKDAWDKKADDVDFKAYVVSGKEAEKLYGRRAPVDKDGEAYVVVFTQIKLTSKTKNLIVQFDGWANNRKTEMTVRYSDKTTEDLKLLDDAMSDNLKASINGNDVIKIVVTDDDNKDISEVTRLIDSKDKKDVYGFVKLRKDVLTLVGEDGKEHDFYTVDAKEFGSLATAKRVKISHKEGSQYLDAILVVSDKWDISANPKDTTTPTTGVVTYIKGDVVTAADDVVVTVTLPKDNEKAYQVKVVDITAGTAAVKVADFYATKEIDATALGINTTLAKDNEYNVIVEVKKADGTYEKVDNKIVKTVDPAKTSLTSAKITQEYKEEVKPSNTVGNMKVYALGTDNKLTIETQADANAALTFAATTGGHVIKLANDELGNVKTTWLELVNYINGNATLKAAYKAELTGSDVVAAAVAEVTLDQNSSAEQIIKVTLTFDKALKDGTGKVTIDGKDYTVSISGTPTTVVVDLATGVKTAAKVEKLGGFTNAAGTPAILPAGGLAITK